MKRVILAAIVLGSVAVSLYAEDPEIKLRELRLRPGESIGESEQLAGDLVMTTIFDVKKAPLFEEAVFHYYLLLTPRDKGVKPQLLHCRMVYRYLERKSGYKTHVSLPREMKECINPRDEKYAVVVVYKGAEVAVKNSEGTRWWEDPELGAPIENVFRRYSDVPYVREWESVKK